MIYLDNAATTKIYKEVQEARNKVEDESFANSSSLHSLAFESQKLIKETKEKISQVINSNPNEIYFTKGATEANNIAISSFAGEDSVAVTTKIEHSSVFDSFRNYSFKEVRHIANDYQGKLDLEDLKAKITPEVKLVSIIYVNNEIGTIADIKAISDIVKAQNKNAIIHIDATQAVGKVDSDVIKLGVDLMSFSAHKFHGPKGVGALYVRNEIIDQISPVLFGGRQQIFSSGTDNHPAIYAMGLALEETIKRDDYNYLLDLNNYLRDLIEEEIEDILVLTPYENFSHHILTICFANIKSEVLLHMLEEEEIYVSSGSACSKGNNNRILEGLGIEEKYKDGMIRFSFSDEITKDDLNFTFEILKKSIATIRMVMK